MKLANKSNNKILSLVLAIIASAAPTSVTAAEISGLTGGSLNKLPTVKLPVTRKINNLRAKSPFPKLDAVAKENARLESIAKDPLTFLPQTLAIVDRLGNQVLNEVIVEHGYRAIEREWLLLVDQDEMLQLKKLKIEIISQKQYASLGLHIVRFKVQGHLDSREALGQMLPASLLSKLARNHVYFPQTETSNLSPSQAVDNAISQSMPISSSNPKSKNASCSADLKIGMIDTDIQLNHPGLVDQNIIAKNFISQDLNLPKGHGTVIAGVLKANSKKVQGLLPNAKLYAASVFYSRNDYSQGATLVHLIEALEWLSNAQVKVINMSLTGPHNQVLQSVIQAAHNQKIAIVAAAGNQGPAAPALYPAAYPSVLAVSAVDQTKQIYRWANQGKYIDFVALGVAVPALSANGAYSIESGTSLAAPVVTAALACELYQSDFETAVNNLTRIAGDLGETGHDPVFGYGLIE
jgi:hypothetical protein